jgi:transcriptional regulator with XRE-family HTH domain
VLKDARKKSGLCQYQVAQLLSYKTKEDTISEDTISNWECNRAMPDPEQVHVLEGIYEVDGLWDDWMRQQYPSYRQRIPKRANVSNPALAVVQAGYEMQDVAKLTEPLGRDLIDGKLDDPVLKQEYISQVNQALSALTAAVTLLGGGKQNEGLQGV